jgi:hypothetical protein
MAETMLSSALEKAKVVQASLPPRMMSASRASCPDMGRKSSSIIMTKYRACF